MRTILLPQHPHRRRKNHIRHIKYTQHDIILVTLEPEIHIHAICFRIPEISFIKRVEEIHHCEHGEDADVEFED